MTTSPQGWRNRAHEAQLVARRLAQTARALTREGAARLSAWTRVLGSDLAVIAGRPPSEAVANASSRATDARESAPAQPSAWATAARALMGATWRGTRGAVQWLRRALTAERRDGLTSVAAQPGDDIGTILGRLESADGADIVLVVSRRIAAMRTPAAWLRLAGHARRRGLNVMVVAARPEVRDYARQTGFVVARSRRGLPGARSRLALPGLGESVWPSALSLLGGLAILGGGVAYALPTARIEVAPPTEPLEARVLLRINPLAPAIDVRTRTVPATTVLRNVRAMVSAPTTGSVRVGDKPAGARLEFRNEGEQAVELPTGTVVRDATRLGFATVEALRIEAGQSAAIDAIATRPGPAGNVPPGALRLLDDAPAGLSVTNPAPARGGTDCLAPGVAQADVDRVQRLAEDVLARVAVRQVRAEQDGGLVLPESVSIAIVSNQPLQELDEPAEVFVAEYVARAAVQVVLPETARAFAEDYLATLLPAGRSLVPGQATARFANAAELDGGRLQVEATLSSASAVLLDEAMLADAIAGANPAEARALLRERLHLDSDPRVAIGPRWLPWPWLPRRASRIEFVLTTPPAPATAGAVTAP